MITTMDPSYWLLMVFHLVGIFYNMRLFISCFKDKTKYTVLQNCRPLMTCQSILQLILLSLNANEATTAFTNKREQEWCGTNSILMTSAGFLMIYNILAMLAIEHHTIVGLTKAISPKLVMLMLGILSSGVAVLLCIFPVETLCTSHVAVTVAGSLIMVLVLLVLWRVCTHSDEDTVPSTDTYTLLNFLSKNKISVFHSILIALGIVVIIVLDVISSVACRFQQSEEMFQNIKFVEKVIYLYLMCLAVGISLPMHFKQIIESYLEEADEKAIVV